MIYNSDRGASINFHRYTVFTLLQVTGIRTAGELDLTDLMCTTWTDPAWQHRQTDYNITDLKAKIYVSAQQHRDNLKLKLKLVKTHAIKSVSTSDSICW